MTLLHTNDLHSHFRAEKNALGLGGIARLTTAVRAVRAQTPGALLLDAGDWSEGNAYYMLGTGRETLRLMGAIGYDVAVVGNHDWLNGPDRLLDAYESSGTRTGLVAANVNLEEYAQAERFKRLIPPYTIRQVGGAKIAFIGVLTFEKIYDSYFKPVGIKEPFLPVARLASQLKKEVDAVVLISHNAIAMNKLLLQAARDADLVIGGHDHKKLTEPVIVERPRGTTAWIVETGSWGRYLGRVELSIEPRRGGEPSRVSLLRYGLTQIDSSIAEDPAIAARVEALEGQLEQLYGEPIFHDHVADVEDDLTRTGPETWMGNLAADTYRETARAEVAFEQKQFVYGEILKGRDGRVRSVDVLNAAPAIYDPAKGKSWTIHTLTMTGKVMENLLKAFFSTRAAANGAGLAGSNIEVVYSPLTEGAAEAENGFGPASALGVLASRQSARDVIRSLRIGGAPVDRDRGYKVAVSGGLVSAFRFLNALDRDIVPLDDLTDTGRESWRAIAANLKSRGSFGHRHIPFGNRFRSLSADLSIRDGDVRIEALGPVTQGSSEARVRIRVTVRNVGASPSAEGATLMIADNARRANLALTPAWRLLALPDRIPVLQPGQERQFEYQATVRGERGVYPVLARITANDGEAIESNDELVTVFRP
ncbi:MAG TPA: metallophosphoesterase [Bdellovibrionota bacterium]|nr:metallophosphoesterase [Bdellovibrionota bacterium]